MKEDIVPVARLDNGLGLYRYRYRGYTQAYVGVMAHEVQRLAPQAVVRAPDGYWHVDYARLGLQLMTWND